MKTNMTLREKLRGEIEDGNWAYEACGKQHEYNYGRLDVHRDGALEWREDIDRSTRTIDDQAESPNCEPLPTLCLVGTGSQRCNCDSCAAGNDPHDGIGDDDASTMLDRLLDELDLIPVGFFDDEVSR